MEVGANSITSNFGLGSLSSDFGDNDLGTTLPLPDASERQKRKTAARQDSQNRMYIKELRLAWNVADRDQRGFLDFDQWKSSSFRFTIRDGKMSQHEFDQYFAKIDANNDGRITWSELVQFLIQELQSDDLIMNSKASRSLSKSNTPISVKQHFHRHTVKQILDSKQTEEYITLSIDAVRFWTKHSLSYRRELKLHDNFSCACVFTRLPILTVATETRRLYFYGIVDLDQLPITASPSPSPTDIRAMRRGESRSALSRLKSNSSLFNIPLVMMEGCLNQCKDLSTQLIVGDDCGFVEFFTLTIPKRRTSTDYKFVQSGNKQIHDAAITKIAVIDYYTCYATASADGTVKFWRPDLSVTHVFNEGTSVSSFAFCASQRALVICATGRVASVWSTDTVRRLRRLMDSNSPSTLVSEFVPMSGDQYFVTFNARKELFLWDGMNMSLKGNWSDKDYLPPENTYGDVLFDSESHCMVVAAGYPILWGESKLTRPTGITHQEEIVGCHYSQDFDQLVTVDISPTFSVWDYTTGDRKSTRKPEFAEISASTLDPSGRRLLTGGCDGDVNLWNFSSGTVIGNGRSRDKQQISVLNYFSLASRQYFLTGGWSHQVYLYSEIDKAKFQAVRTYEGHQDDISAAAVDNSGWIITCSVIGEVYAWNIDGQASHSTNIELPIEAVGIFKHRAIVADSNGYLTVFTIPGLDAVAKEKGHPIIVRHAITSIAIDGDCNTMITGDSLGYVRFWQLALKAKLTMDPKFFVRCSESEITSIVHIRNFFATASVDMAVRLWSSRDGTFVGTFGVDKWTLSLPGTWQTSCPAAKDPEHFESKDDQPKVLAQPSASEPRMKIPKIFDSPSMLAPETSEPKTKPAAVEEEDHEFDWERAQEMLQVLNSGTLSPMRQMSQPLFTTERPSSHLIDFGVIPMRSEPQSRQLMSRIRQLQESKPYKPFEPDLSRTLQRRRK